MQVRAGMARSARSGPLELVEAAFLNLGTKACRGPRGVDAAACAALGCLRSGLTCAMLAAGASATLFGFPALPFPCGHICCSGSIDACGMSGGRYFSTRHSLPFHAKTSEYAELIHPGMSCVRCIYSVIVQQIHAGMKGVPFQPQFPRKTPFSLEKKALAMVCTVLYVND